MKMKAEARAILLKVKEHQKLPVVYQKLGKRHGTDSHSLQKESTLPTT